MARTGVRSDEFAVSETCACGSFIVTVGPFTDELGVRHDAAACCGPLKVDVTDGPVRLEGGAITRDHYAKRFGEILDQMREITVSKNANYANDADAFQNFRLIEHMSGGRVSTTDGLLTRMGDKFQRLVNLAGGAKNNHESFADNCIDLAVYTIILLIHEESQRK